MRSRFFCTECGNQGIPIIRKNCKLREKGHLKKLYCIHCKKDTNHVEIKEDDHSYEYEDFLLEFRTGRFVDGQRVPISKLNKCINHNCPNCILGKCWDAANKSHCRYKEKNV